MRAISDAAPNDAIFLADTGTATAWTARHLRVQPGQRYTQSGGLATLAFAFSGVLGAQLAYPDRRVIAICSDAAGARPSRHSGGLGEGLEKRQRFFHRTSRHRLRNPSAGRYVD